MHACPPSGGGELGRSVYPRRAPAPRANLRFDHVPDPHRASVRCVTFCAPQPALRARDGITLLIVEHDLDFVMRACDRVIVMNDGRVIAQGTPEEVRRDEQVVDAYLGARR